MINFILTQVCNRRCPYCFAAEMMRSPTRGVPAVMSPELFRAGLDLADRSRSPEIRLLGGEPTLHPRFREFTAEALGRGLHVKVFTNGLIPEEPLAFLEGLPPESVSVLVNLNPPSSYSESEWRRVRLALGRLGRRVTCGVNIDRPDFEAEFCLQLVQEHGLYPALRLGLAHPVMAGGNHALPWEASRLVARRVIDLARKADPLDVILGFDCGFTLCMFRDYYHDLIDLRIEVRCQCRPVLDLTPDGQLWYCLALWGESGVDLSAVTSLADARDHFHRQFAPLRATGMLPECADCKFLRTGQCSGGCLVRNLQQWR